MTIEEIQYEAQGIMQEWGSNDSAPYVEFVEKLASMELPEPPSNLDEAAEGYAWKKEEPLTDGERLSSAFNPRIDAFKAGAEWMAGQGFPRWRHIDKEKPKQGEDCACITVTVNGRIKYSNFEEGPWFWSEKIDDELLGETEAFIGYDFYGDKEYHSCSYWMPWDEFMGVLERQFKR